MEPNYLQRFRLILERDRMTQADFDRNMRRNMNTRERIVLTRTKGKPLLYREPEMLELLNKKSVPTQMQHCVLAVMPKVQGDEKQRFLSAFNICAATFEKYGYQRHGMVLTGKGLRNNMQHRREPEAGSKQARFTSLLQRLWIRNLEWQKKQKEQQREREIQAKLTRNQKPQK